eukprot:6903762-Prymnesium_polylepis.1
MRGCGAPGACGYVENGGCLRGSSSWGSCSLFFLSSCAMRLFQRGPRQTQVSTGCTWRLDPFVRPAPQNCACPRTSRPYMRTWNMHTRCGGETP